MKQLAESKIQEIRGLFKPDHTDTEHWYVHTKTGARLPSVTTVTAIVRKPWLDRWKIKEGLKYLVETHGDQISERDLPSALEAAIMASEVKSEEASSIGDAVHDTIEKWLIEWIKTGHKPEISLVNFYSPNFVTDEITHLKYDLTQTQIIACLRSADKMFNEFNVTPIAVEITVGDVESGYAGKLDALMLVDGELEIWDWKTSNMIPTEDFRYPMQINAYRKAFEKMTGLEISKQRIVQLSKSEDRFTIYEVDISDDLLEAFKALVKFYGEARNKLSRYYRSIRRDVS